MFIATDLHGHTVFSDGRATPEEYVEFRHRIGMKAIAIADHDVLAGVRRGAAAAAAHGMFFIPGLEVTSFIHFGRPDEEQFHILAYYTARVLEGTQLESSFLYRRGQRVQARWRDFVLEWLRALPAESRSALDPENRFESVHPARFPALQSMIRLIVERQRHLFEAFRDHHVHFWEDRELFGWTPEEAIDAIRADGATDIVAHPARYRDKERTARVLDLATGVEVYTSRHKPEVAAEFLARAEAKRKFWTSSSDDHQNARYIRPPCGSPVMTLEKILRQTMPMSMILAA